MQRKVVESYGRERIESSCLLEKRLCPRATDVDAGTLNFHFFFSFTGENKQEEDGEREGLFLSLVNK